MPEGGDQISVDTSSSCSRELLGGCHECAQHKHVAYLVGDTLKWQAAAEMSSALAQRPTAVSDGCALWQDHSGTAPSHDRQPATLVSEGDGALQGVMGRT